MQAPERWSVVKYCVYRLLSFLTAIPTSQANLGNNLCKTRLQMTAANYPSQACNEI